jgi:hypothetical protein
MAVVSADIKLYLSGGASNADPLLSLGGIISSTLVSATALNNLWDNVTDAEALAGNTDYRCIYVNNTNVTDTLAAAKAYILSNTPSADTTITVGLDPVGVGNGTTTGVATTVANEATAPAGVTFVAAANLAAALVIGDMAHNVVQALWLKRVVNAASEPVTSDPSTIRITGTP